MSYSKVPDSYFQNLNKKSMAKTMDKKLVAYDEAHEISYLCKKFKIKKAVLLALVAILPKRHSRKEVEAVIKGYLAGKDYTL